MNGKKLNNYFEQCLNKFKTGDIYLDVFYHPAVCLHIDIDDERKDIGLEGVSLFDGSYPRGCSVVHSAPDKITPEEALKMKEEYEKSRISQHGSPRETLCYADGQDIMIDDRIRLGNDEGIVASVMDRKKYPSAFSPDIWEGYRKRAVIKFSKSGFAHYIRDMDPNIKLLSREARPKGKKGGI